MSELSGDGSGPSELSEMCSQRVAPRDDRGGLPDLIRKRKRAMWRAYKNKRWSQNVLSFVHEQQSRKMLKDMTRNFYAPMLLDEITRPLGLLAWVKEEDK